jgi:hypothetical protein
MSNPDANSSDPAPQFHVIRASRSAAALTALTELLRLYALSHCIVDPLAIHVCTLFNVLVGNTPNYVPVARVAADELARSCYAVSRSIGVSPGECGFELAYAAYLHQYEPQICLHLVTRHKQQLQHQAMQSRRAKKSAGVATVARARHNARVKSTCLRIHNLVCSVAMNLPTGIPLPVDELKHAVDTATQTIVGIIPVVGVAAAARTRTIIE